jgi:hypothetical protein
MAGPQSYPNHSRFDPLFHFFVLPVSALCVFMALWHLYKQPNITHGLLVIISVAVLTAVFKIRLYALRVQDRVIRLEERLRLALLLQEPLRKRIGDLTEGQLIAIRFASDAEVPELVSRALNEKLSRSDIKKAVKNWRADDWRV